MRENIWKNIKLGFKTNKLAVAGAVAILLLALISIFAFLYPVDPNAISATERLNAPSMSHLFGTDDMGRDYLARCIYGGRASILVGFLTWMNIARIVRGETISLNEREYVIYAKISGQKKFSTIVHHILPNIMPTIIVAATMNIANAILMESALSFFGLGIQPPTASWGSMLSNAQRYIQQAPYLAIFPGILILITVISFNYLGEVLRKVFEPK